jgi:MarR family transcriptional regulator for hemolysin
MTLRNEALRSAFGPLLSQSVRLWRRAVDRRLQPYGLTEATWLPLIRLSRMPEAVRQKELAAAMNLDSSAVVRLLDSLQAAGLVERREENGDRRAKTIVLTADGRDLVRRVEAAAAEVRDGAFDGLSEADIETASRVLGHICRALTTSEGMGA